MGAVSSWFLLSGCHSVRVLQELTFPLFEADDLKRLGEEMNKLMWFQREARGFRLMLYLLSHVL